MQEAKSKGGGDAILGIVGSVVDAGSPKGFIVAYVAPGVTTEPPISDKDSITCSLAHWRGGELPHNGQMVELRGVTKYAKGWRASSACPVAAVAS